MFGLSYSVSQKNPPPKIFWHFFPNSLKFLVQILHAYYTFPSTLENTFLFYYLQLWRSYAILSERDHHHMTASLVYYYYSTKVLDYCQCQSMINRSIFQYLL